MVGIKYVSPCCSRANITVTKQQARELTLAESGCKLKPDEAPDEVRDTAGGGELVFIMPDAGCC